VLGIVTAGFSGHGFKLAPVVGTLAADLALDPTSHALPLFRAARVAR
jgi:glycine/D-amino acid oxidase-like deaminating enzyme